MAEYRTALAEHENHLSDDRIQVVVYDADPETTESAVCGLRMEGMVAYPVSTLAELHDVLMHERIAFIVSDQPPLSMIDQWYEEELSPVSSKPSILSIGSVMQCLFKKSAAKLFEALTR